MFVGFASWLLSIVLSKASQGILKGAVEHLSKSVDGVVKLEEIRTTAAVSLASEDTKRLADHNSMSTQRQGIKMNQPMFWALIAIMIGPPALLMWSVAIYNILWWDGTSGHGIWPQEWSIADFPPSIKPWANAAVNWLYDPLGPPTAVGSSFIASILAGRR